MNKHSFFKAGKSLVAETLQPGLRKKFFKAAIKTLTRKVIAQGRLPDPEIIRTSAKKDLQKEGRLAVEGYADWLASKIWIGTRRGRDTCETMPLPECSPTDRALIAENYNVRRDVLDAVIDAMAYKSTYLQPIGIIKNGIVTIERQNLSAWGRSFAWPDKPQKASPRIKP